ncbi:MAG: hypothetical protein HOP12_06175 [Candidatus Eisenbacteria bacterium]|uniref:Uncharacterized protein n=1 Tax=Eiseniibacteriota bacterium TaxID=2212470 RepID=A0A849SEE2_UNCEI|nr:hypothetical protein [Candidatus Eisenbacteria bacterium]
MKRDGLVLLFLSVLAILGVALAVEVVVVTRAWLIHRTGNTAAEIAWLQAARPFVPWDASVPAQIGRLRREAVRNELANGRLVPALQAFRAARAASGMRAMASDRELMALGIEAFARAADHMEQQGRLANAADWNDSLFVHAVRAIEPHHRAAAVAAFMEGLDLRVRAGTPCAALARVTWAKQGLSGVIPGAPANLERDLTTQCSESRRARRR